MVITPDQYNSTSVYDLLAAAAQGMVGVDQRLLKSIIDRGEAALDDIVRFGMENRPADRINLEEDLVAISQYLGSPKALKLLTEYLRREPLDPSEDLIHAFLRIGDAGIDPLLKLYEELGPEEGGDVAFILAAYRKRDPRILELLEQRLEHDPQDAAFLMGIHCDPAAKPILELVKQNAESGADPDPAVANEAAEALEAIATPGEPEPPEPVSLWDLYPEHIEPVFEVMSLEERLEFLRCKSAELRADAATSFIDRDVPDEAAEILIGLAKDDPNVGVRAVANEALSSLVDDKQVRKLLMNTLESSRPIPERCGALLALAPRTKEIPAVKRHIEEFYSNPATQARAMEAMWRSMDRDFAGHFRRHLNDADVDIRRQAIKGAGYLELESEAPKLVELFRDEEFRLDALFAYALCVPAKRLQRGDVTGLLRKIEEMAGGLTEAEGEVVETALDTRLMLHGMEPVFLPLEDEDGA
ncbi:MAG: hypothetical protein SFV51_20070 [Bryobacteraceae bacterium]|nr:hypothetical protein [Bryobacteraceae bacterium]